MNITIVGAGHIGGNIARRLALAEHTITVSFARDEQALQALAAEIGGRAATPAEAVADAEVVVISVPWGAIPDALEQAGPLAGKIVIDTTNQFGAGPKPAEGQTAAAFNAARMPGARYTKSFNTLTSGSRRARRGASRASCSGWPATMRREGDRCRADRRRRLRAGRRRRNRGLRGDRGAPTQPGSVYGEEYRLAEARQVVEAVRAGRRSLPPLATRDPSHVALVSARPAPPAQKSSASCAPPAALPRAITRFVGDHLQSFGAA